MFTEILNIVDLLGHPTVVIVTVGPAHCCYCHMCLDMSGHVYVWTWLDMAGHGWTWAVGLAISAGLVLCDYLERGG